MLVFLSIAIAFFIIMTFGFIFGHDHDLSHDHDISHDHDAGHDGGGNTPAISIFSSRVLATFGMGFGAAGAIARSYGCDYLISSLWGVGFGTVLGGLMYLVLKMFYAQQASSEIPTSAAVGRVGAVTVGIEGDRLGEVSVSVNDQSLTYTASSKDGTSLPKGQTVRVAAVVGDRLVVEKA
jgi:membrane protein implicated in regulation of membrane protease activity